MRKKWHQAAPHFAGNDFLARRKLSFDSALMIPATYLLSQRKDRSSLESKQILSINTYQLAGHVSVNIGVTTCSTAARALSHIVVRWSALSVVLIFHPQHFLRSLILSRRGHRA